MKNKLSIFSALSLLVGLCLSSTTHAQSCGFRANKNYVAQDKDFAVNSYSLLTFSSKSFDIGNRFQNSRFTPVPLGRGAKLVHFSGQVWVSQNAVGGPPIYAAKIIKNGGADVFQGIGVPSAFVNSFVISFSGTDLAQPGDYYELYLYSTNPEGTPVVDGNPAHTWFSAHCIN